MMELMDTLRRYLIGRRGILIVVMKMIMLIRWVKEDRLMEKQMS